VKTFDLKNEPGWAGYFTRQEVDGALKNGTRVVKAISENGNRQPNGTPGVILGSMSRPGIKSGEVCYFVEWASMPRCAVAVMSFKLRVVDGKI